MLSISDRYIIDPKNRYLDLRKITNSIGEFCDFNEWRVVDDHLICRADWLISVNSQLLYLLAQEGALIMVNEDGYHSEITWSGTPPSEDYNMFNTNCSKVCTTSISTTFTIIGMALLMGLVLSI